MPTVTINGVVYEVYGDLPDANAYLQAQITATAWAAASDLTKSQALVSMTRVLDRQKWLGQPTDGYLGMAFPRTGIFYPDNQPVDPGIVPFEVIFATFEGAAQLVAGVSIEDVASTFNYNRLIKAGSVEIEYFRQTGAAPRFPQVIMELIGQWLGGVGQVAARAFGTRKRSIMGEKYDVSRAF